MVAFFRSINGWLHIAQLDALSWDIPLYSATNKAGSLQVPGDHQELADVWVILNGHVFYVDKAAPNSTGTTLSLKAPINAFSRSIAFSPLTGSLESYIAGVLTSSFINQTDLAYAMPYLAVTSSGETNIVLTYKSGEVFDFLEVLRLAVERGIEFSFTPKTSTLEVSIHPRVSSSYNVVLGDSHSQFKSYTRSYGSVAKVTVRRVTVQEDGSINVNDSQDWFVQPDGSVSTIPPSPRIRGKWAIVSVEDLDITSEQAAIEAAGAGADSYKLTFYSDKAFNMGDTLNVRFRGMEQEGQVSSCSVSRNDTRYLYEMGTMPTTLTEKLVVKEDMPEQSVTVEGAGQDYLARSGGSVGGSLNVTQTLKAGTLVLSPDSYGTALPPSGVEGQVFFLLT